MNKLKILLFLGLFCGFIAGCKSSTSPSGNGGSGPTINSFTATPSSIDFNTAVDSSLLQWSIDGATTVTIDQGVGDETANSNQSVAVYPSATTTYTLTAKNSSGTSTKTVTVTVTNNTSQPNSPPTPTQLTANAGAAALPSTINLSWSEPSGGTSASHFIIERWISGQMADTINAAAPGPTTYTDAQLYPTFIYFYRVKAVSSSGAASAWSNTAWAIAPGPAPIINTISLTPTTVPTLAPGQTQVFTATAFDASNNPLPIAQGAFHWSSSNGLIATVNGHGLVTASSQQGSATITASLPDGNGGNPIVSNAVTVAVANKSGNANTLVIWYGSSDASQFTQYLAPLAASGVTYDQVSDFSNSGAAAFSLSQLTPYSRVVVIQESADLSTDAESILAEYAGLGGKKLVVVTTQTNGEIYNTTLGTYLGVTDDYIPIGSVGPTMTGVSGTAFAGLSFTKQDIVSSFGRFTLTSPGPSTAAITGTDISDGSTFVAAFQAAITGGTTILYSGVPIEGVDAAHQNAYAHAFMNF